MKNLISYQAFVEQLNPYQKIKKIQNRRLEDNEDMVEDMEQKNLDTNNSHSEDLANNDSYETN